MTRNRTPTRNPSQYYQDALNEVMLSVQPLLNQIDRSRSQGRYDYRDRMAQAKNITRTAGNQLGDIGGYYAEATTGLPGQLTQELGGLSSLLGSDTGVTAPGEAQAGRNMVGAIGSGALEQLSTNQARNAAYNASAGRQNVIEGQTTRRNYNADFQRFLDDLQARSIDVMESVPAQVQSVQRNMENDAFNRRMAQAQLGLSRQGLALQREQIAAEQAAAAAAAAAQRRFIKALLGQGGTVNNPATSAGAGAYTNSAMTPQREGGAYGMPTGTGTSGGLSGLGGSLQADTTYGSLFDQMDAAGVGLQQWIDSAIDYVGQGVGSVANAYEDKYKSFSDYLWELLGGS